MDIFPYTFRYMPVHPWTSSAKVDVKVQYGFNGLLAPYVKLGK